VAATVLSGQVYTYLSLRRPVLPRVMATAPQFPRLSRGDGVLGCDGWTVRTADGSPSAHYEHTILLARAKPILLTAA
jgi:hypothetical protein